MSIAYTAAMAIAATCKAMWPDGHETMQSNWAEHMAAHFDGASYASHKYLPGGLEESNAYLNLPSGAGLYGFWKFSDGTWLGLTCGGRVTVCDSGGLRFPAFKWQLT